MSSRRRPSQGRSISRLGIISVAVIIVLVIALVVARTVTAPSLANQDNQPVPASVLQSVTHVPVATANSVGKGTFANKLIPVNGTPLRDSSGKPEIFYLGAEYCPYCASMRWALVVTLSRFGSFTGLKLMTSSSADVYPSTPTFTFYKAQYTSPYISFVSVEEQTNQLAGNTYAPLQTPTAAQKALISTYDGPPYVAASAAGTIPFLDLGNHFIVSGAPFDPQILQGENWQDIANAIQQPNNATAQAVLGAANTLTAAICAIDGGQPASVCNVPAVHAISLP
ncbi:MAG: DUF929 domain-containing protein [Chloroflexi bacterium]|nr:DUF929 domain-containing protein [Chloroflexota bacterium]